MLKNIPTPTSITQFKTINNAILFPFNSCGKFKYITLNSITKDSNKNTTEKYVANLCI